MARIKDREKALELRAEGMSYSQIKERLGISKSTLHYWLRDHPLSEARIRELRDHSAQRIEKTRETKRKKRQNRQEKIRQQVREEIGTLSKRELFLAGLFLYWGEGSKTRAYSISVTNTDPAMMRFFVEWLCLVGVDLRKTYIRLHLYSDMDTEEKIMYWSSVLDIPKQSFQKPYIKNSKFSKRRNYKGRFGHGTCSVTVSGRDLEERVSAGIQVLREGYT